MVSTRFQVAVSDISCCGLTAKDRSGTSDPYVKGNFDNFKRFASSVHKKTLDPVFDVNIKFDYETQYRSRLGSKFLVLSVFDKDKFSSDDLIGETKVDLHTLATGPVKHDLALTSKSGKPAGRIRFSLTMVERAETRIVFKELAVQNLPELDGGVNSYFMVSNSMNKNQTPGNTVTHQRNPVFDKMPAVRLSGSLSELLKGTVFLSLFLEGQGSEPLFVFPLKIYKHSDFSGDTQYLSEDCVSDSGQHYPLTGSFHWVDFPTLNQMNKGLHTEHGISDWEVVHEEVELPKCPCSPPIENVSKRIKIRTQTIPLIKAKTVEEEQLELEQAELEHVVLPPYSPMAVEPVETVPEIITCQLPSNPVASKPTATKPSMPKPVSTKPPGPKPVSTKPSGPKPVSTKPSGPKPVSTKPSGPKPVSTKPPGPKPISTKPPGPKPSSRPPGPKPTSPPLPEGFEEALDPKGKVYYIDHFAKNTCRTRPAALPKGWERKYDDRTEKSFYVDHNTRTTHWNAPQV